MTIICTDTRSRIPRTAIAMIAPAIVIWPFKLICSVHDFDRYKVMRLPGQYLSFNSGQLSMLRGMQIDNVYLFFFMWGIFHLSQNRQFQFIILAHKSFVQNLVNFSGYNWTWKGKIDISCTKKWSSIVYILLSLQYINPIPSTADHPNRSYSTLAHGNTKSIVYKPYLKQIHSPQ